MEWSKRWARHSSDCLCRPVGFFNSVPEMHFTLACFVLVCFLMLCCHQATCVDQCAVSYKMAFDRLTFLAAIAMVISFAHSVADKIMYLIAIYVKHRAATTKYVCGAILQALKQGRGEDFSFDSSNVSDEK